MRTFLVLRFLPPRGNKVVLSKLLAILQNVLPQYVQWVGNKSSGATHSKLHLQQDTHIGQGRQRVGSSSVRKAEIRYGIGCYSLERGRVLGLMVVIVGQDRVYGLIQLGLG